MKRVFVVMSVAAFVFLGTSGDVSAQGGSGQDYAILLDEFQVNGPGAGNDGWFDDFNNGDLGYWDCNLGTCQEEPGTSYVRLESPGKISRFPGWSSDLRFERSDIGSWGIWQSRVFANQGWFEGVAIFAAELPKPNESISLQLNCDLNDNGRILHETTIVEIKNPSLEMAALVDGVIPGGLKFAQYRYVFDEDWNYVDFSNWELESITAPEVLGNVILSIRYDEDDPGNRVLYAGYSLTESRDVLEPFSPIESHLHISSAPGNWVIRAHVTFLRDDGSLTSGSGYEDRVTDDVYGDQAAVWVPGTILPNTYPTEPIDVSIHVFDEPLPIPGVAAAGTKFMHIDIDPEPPSPLPPMGLSVKIPLLEPMVEFSSHYSIQPECGPRYLDLQRVDPLTGELVPAQMWVQRCVRDPCSAAYPWNYEAFLYPRVRCMPASPWVPCPPGIPSYCGSCGSTALCHYVATFSTVVGVLPEDFPVIIDIKPGGFPNSINTKSKGVIPVAILGDETFDFALIDLATLSFGPGGATPDHGIHPEDVNGDGITDLVLHFSTRETGLAVGDTEACIAGQTFDFGSGNLPITGCDSVRIIR